MENWLIYIILVDACVSVAFLARCCFACKFKYKGKDGPSIMYTWGPGTAGSRRRPVRG